MLLRSAFRLRPAISSALLASLLVAVPAAAHAQAASSAIASLHPVAQNDRISAHPDFAPLTQLKHQLPGWMQGRPQSSAHAVDLSTPIRVSLVLNRDPSVESAFQQFLADQQTPGSPLFHQWLTPQQVGSLFGPTANDLAALTSWLTSQGLKVDSIAPSGVIVHASGSAAIVGNAFHTTFAMFSPDEGLTAAPRLSAVSEPSIPTALTPLVRSIAGLGELEVKPLNFAHPVKGTPRSAAHTSSTIQPMFSNGPAPDTYFITPGDFATIFDINTVYTGGNKGATIGSKAQRIAVIGESRITNTDITEFEQITGLPSTVPTVVIPTGDTDPGTTANGFQDEATLDVDRVIATAPGAGVDLVIAEQFKTSGGIFDAAQYNVDVLLDPVMTISFGACESSNGLASTNDFDAIASTGAAEGITTLVSSGDSGAAGCDTSFSKAPTVQNLSINFICSSTYVTCVGGTEFNDTADPALYWSTTNSSTLVSALSYIPEGGWNEPSTTTTTNNVMTTTYAPAASGGGVSTFIAKPTWQTGTGVPGGSFRFVPDVALPASAHDGYFACLAYNGGNCQNNYFEAFSGTSAAAPGFAGIVALINTQVGTAAGNINPLLYQLATSTPAAFHDTTIATSGVTGCVATTPSMCNNSTPGPTTLTGGLSGYLLTTGYDEVTGLGSVDVKNLVTAAAVGATSPISTTLTLTQPAAITAGNSTTFTVTLTTGTGSTATPTGSVQFYSNGTAIGTAIQLVSDTISSSPQTFPTAGTYTITANYSGDGIYAPATAPGVSLVVNAVVTSGNFTLTASPTSLTVSPVASTNGTPNTGTVPSTITATPTDGFSDIVFLTCAVTPSTAVPPTCAVSPTSVNVTATATATLAITYVGPTSNCSTNAGSAPSTLHIASFGPAALAFLLLLWPFRKRKSMRNLACIILLVTGLASLSGCGGNSSTGVGGGVCSNVVSSGTTPGAYTVTVTGTGTNITKTATVALTVN